jgi:hypothetical protein
MTEWKVVVERSAAADRNGLETKLNELASQGWEMHTVEFDDAQPWYRIVAHRPKRKSIPMFEFDPESPTRRLTGG